MKTQTRLPHEIGNENLHLLLMSGDTTEQTTLADQAACEVIYKIQETCNLNCSYCYMYNKGNDLFNKVPPSSPIEVAENVGRLLGREFRTRNPLYANLIIHGGEPMLMPPHRFRERMSKLLGAFEEEAGSGNLHKLAIGLQTNATLVTEDWINVASEFNIGIGVTIDGPKLFHDQYRIDRAGRGSYDQVVRGIRSLQSAAVKGRIPYPGCLSVINPDLSGTEAYDHIVHELGFRSLDFLLPFRDWDDVDADHVRKVSDFLCSAFRRWIQENDNVKVRVFETAIRSFISAPSNQIVHKTGGALNHFYVVVESDGSIMPDESVRVLINSRFSSLNVSSVSLSDVVADAQFQALIHAQVFTPSECIECALLSACQGGRTLGRVGDRYSRDTGFTRKSVYSEAFIDLYLEVARYVQGAKGQSLRLSAQGSLAFIG